MQKVIVDGYNVIHAAGLARGQRGGGMERARDGLVDRLRAYVAHKHVQVTVVFDGRGGITDSLPIVAGRLQVVYSAAGETADDVIVSTLRAHANPREYIVVSSDMADIGREARALGATVMSSGEFLARIAAEPAARQGGDETTAGRETSAAEVDYWLERFEHRESDDGE